MVEQTNNLFTKIDKLPLELVEVIYEYIPIQVKIVLTKENYFLNHKLLHNYINNTQIELYFRHMVRRDYDFIFNQLLYENHMRWINMKQYLYEGCVYNNYLHFLTNYCGEHQSTKCKSLITNLLEELGLSKNQHKKNKIRYIRWKK